ncbi:MAG: hypothetical protein IJC07_05150 [Clostridia bacterium]|nr:hypothetical protein [Clostridia bacterium]
MKTKFLRSLLCVVLAMGMIFSIGCGGKEEDGKQSQNEIQLAKELESAKSAYDELSLAFTYSKDMASAVHSIWNYSIYYASDDKSDMVASGSRVGWGDFLVKRVILRTSGMPSESILKEALKNVTGQTDGAFWANALENISYAVAVAKEYNRLSDGLRLTTACIEKSKTFIGDLTDANKEATHRDDLASLYSSINSFYQLIENPSGNFSSYGASITNCKNNINNLINTLDLYF